MNQVISKNINKINEICKSYNVQSLFAFGSVCSDHFSSSSDIDLLITFKPLDFDEYADNYFTIAYEFEKVFQRSVDLITDKSLLNPYFIESVNKTKLLIYEE